MYFDHFVDVCVNGYAIVPGMALQTAGANLFNFRAPWDNGALKLKLSETLSGKTLPPYEPAKLTLWFKKIEDSSFIAPKVPLYFFAGLFGVIFIVGGTLFGLTCVITAAVLSGIAGLCADGLAQVGIIPKHETVQAPTTTKAEESSVYSKSGVSMVSDRAINESEAVQPKTDAEEPVTAQDEQQTPVAAVLANPATSYYPSNNETIYHVPGPRHSTYAERRHTEDEAVATWLVLDRRGHPGMYIR